MAENRVWIAQCLCGPNRHCILALAHIAPAEPEPSPELIRKLQDVVGEALKDALNPWCGICGAPEAGWRYEVGRTPFRTMKEAGPELAKAEASNVLAGLLFGSHGPNRPGRA